MATVICYRRYTVKRLLAPHTGYCLFEMIFDPQGKVQSMLQLRLERHHC